jgi:hypothetical protein
MNSNEGTDTARDAMVRNLATITTLHKGSHTPPRAGDTTPDACLLEAVAWIAGEPWSDHPACTSPVLGTFGRSLNDCLPDALRQELLPLAPLMVGTAGDGLDEVRSYMALDWLVRTYTPAWLDLAGLTGEAQALRDLRRIVDLVSAEAAGPVVRDGRAKAAAARDAARDAAGAAARDAARDAAWDAARAAARAAAWDAARDAARDAAGAAAWDTARDAAWDAAWVAARDAAGDAAWDTAWDAAGAAAWDTARDAAWDAAWDTAWAALGPTVAELQTSAIALFTSMIHPEQVAW